MSNLPAMVSEHGEVVRLITADHLLEADGLTDLTAADIEQLAAFTDKADHLTAIAREAKGMVSDELIHRLDRAASWTCHEGDYTIKAPSPAAGADKFDTDLLRVALGLLVGQDVIGQEAADAALERVFPEPYWKQKAAGLKALLKRGGVVAEAVEKCRVQADPPKRTAKVTRAKA